MKNILYRLKDDLIYGYHLVKSMSEITCIIRFAAQPYLLKLPICSLLVQAAQDIGLHGGIVGIMRFW